MNSKVSLACKLALGALLAAWVISNVETQDQLVVTEKNGSESAYAGSIQFEESLGTFSFKAATKYGTSISKKISIPDVKNPPPNFEPRPGFFSLLKWAKWEWVWWAIGLWTILVLLASLRWQILLSAAGVQVGYLKALRLCLVGWFFNNVVPGLTGGDLARAVLITRNMTENRWKATMSVIVDRVVGLVVLMALAAFVLGYLLFGESSLPVEKVASLSQAVFLFLGLVFFFSALYLSRRARALLGIEKWLKRLPGASTLGKISEAVTIYRERPRKLLAGIMLSVPLQISGVCAFFCVGKALGADILLAEIFIAFPIAQTLSAIPVSPAGWGVGEKIYGEFFELFGSTFTVGVAVSLLFRFLTQVGFGLLGGLIWMLSAERKVQRGGL